ncbi:hypothetical protein OIU84_027627 [Salix udensis]|uniref:Pentatricopeptide repeat-containing protein n=1 Tax=Salix udensis TaxID=889485 RepID=A0AAD6KFS4_9ROSI|nr:hypothetical protein OIU84_027627 [Salix udensis]
MLLRSSKPPHHHLSATKLLLLRHLKTLPSSSSTTTTTKDAYFSLIHNITNIIRKEVYPERTLNKLNLPITSELVFRVLRASSNYPSQSLRFFNWARSYYSPTTIEYEELIITLVRNKKYASMWKLIAQVKNNLGDKFSVSSNTVCFIIEEYGKHGLIDQAVEEND